MSRLPDDRLLKDGYDAVRLHDGTWYAALETRAMATHPMRRHARWLRGLAALYGLKRGEPSGRVVMIGRDKDPDAGETMHGERMVIMLDVIKEYDRWPLQVGRMGAVMEYLPLEELLPLSLSHPFPNVRWQATKELRIRSLQ